MFTKSLQATDLFLVIIIIIIIIIIILCMASLNTSMISKVACQ